MTVTLSPELEAALADRAQQWGLPPEVVASEILARHLLPGHFVPRDEWERGLVAAATDCGVSLTDEQLSREVIYD